MNGNQSVTLTWAAQNAIGFALTGGGVNEPSLPYDQRSYAVISLPLSSPSTFTLVAAGFDGSGAYTPIYKTITVDPQPAEVIITTSSVQAQVSDPALGTQVATVEWQALNATSVTIIGGVPQPCPVIDRPTTLALSGRGAFLTRSRSATCTALCFPAARTPCCSTSAARCPPASCAMRRVRCSGCRTPGRPVPYRSPR